MRWDQNPRETRPKGRRLEYGLDGNKNSMNRRNSTDVQSVSSMSATGRFAVALTGATMLAGVPFSALAQYEGAQDAAVLPRERVRRANALDASEQQEAVVEFA